LLIILYNLHFVLLENKEIKTKIETINISCILIDVGNKEVINLKLIRKREKNYQNRLKNGKNKVNRNFVLLTKASGGGIIRVGKSPFIFFHRNVVFA